MNRKSSAATGRRRTLPSFRSSRKSKDKGGKELNLPYVASPKHEQSAATLSSEETTALQCWYLGTVTQSALPSTASVDKPLETGLFPALLKALQTRKTPQVEALAVVPRTSSPAAVKVVRAADSKVTLLSLAPYVEILSTKAKPYRRLLASPYYGVYHVVLFEKTDALREVARTLNPSAAPVDDRVSSPSSEEIDTDVDSTQTTPMRLVQAARRSAGDPTPAVGGVSDAGSAAEPSACENTDGETPVKRRSKLRAEQAQGDRLQAATQRYSLALEELEATLKSDARPTPAANPEETDSAPTDPEADPSDKEAMARLSTTDLPPRMRKISGSPRQPPASSEDSEVEQSDAASPEPPRVRRKSRTTRKLPVRKAPARPSAASTATSGKADRRSVVEAGGTNTPVTIRQWTRKGPDLQLCHLLADLQQLITLPKDFHGHLEYRDVDGYRRLCIRD